MASNQLNAGAASFQPGGPPAAGDAQLDPNDSFNAYINEVEDIQEAMDADSGFEPHLPPPSTAAVGVASGLPPHLAKHANEFWFPESRDCACCNGFKHGCQCAASNGGSCASCGTPGGSNHPAPSSLHQQMPPPQARGPPPPNSFYPGPGRGGGRGRGPGGPQVCKFFQSPQGCRFGSGCRFLHA